VKAELLVFPREDHGLSPAETDPGVAVWTVVLENWLRKYDKKAF
jgi:hypothetical protein